jgi:hypothetical protein
MSPDDLPPAEIRIRREIRALAYPLAAAVGVVVSLTATHGWTGIVSLAFAVVCIARWQSDRPRLPGDPDPLPVIARQLRWWLLLVVASAGCLAVGVATVPFHPDQWWTWGLLGAGLVLTAVLGTLIFIGRRNYERARGTS